MELIQFGPVILLIFLLTDFPPSCANISCTFDKGWCDWSNKDGAQFLWKSKAGQTDDRTSGPINDHTCNNIMGQYIFITGHDIKIKDSIAVINSAAFSLDTSSNLTFWYSMNGVGIGKLVLSRVEGKKREDLWERTGRQGRGWMRDFVTLHRGKMTLQFSATAMLPYSSDIALDDIQLDSESTHFEKDHCKLITTTSTTTTRMTTTSMPSAPVHTSRPVIPPACLIATEHAVVLPGSCDFEKDLCGNKISSNMSAGRWWPIEWERTQKSQNYGVARINGDHTKEQDKDSRGYYMNFKNGLGGDHGDTIAIIETPAINSHLGCLTFWYNMPSKYSNLKVLVKHEKLIREVWKREEAISGKHLGWHRVLLVIREQPPYSILFQTYNKEYQAYIGVDDILIIGANTSDSDTSSSAKSTTTPQRAVGFTNSVARSDTSVAKTHSSTSEEPVSKLRTTDISQTEITNRPSTMSASWSSRNSNKSTFSPITTKTTVLPEQNFTKMTKSDTKNASSTVSGPTAEISSSLSGFITKSFKTLTPSSALSSGKSSISYTVRPATEPSTFISIESSPPLSTRKKLVTNSLETTNKLSSSTISFAPRRTELHTTLPDTVSSHTAVGLSSRVTHIPTTLLSTTDFEHTSGGTIDSSTSPSPSSLSSLSVVNIISQTQPTSTSKVTPLNTTASSSSSTARTSVKSRSTVSSKESKKTEPVPTTVKQTKAPKPTKFTKNKKTKCDKQKQNNDDANNDNDLSSAAIAGIVVGSVCVIVVIGLTLYFIVQKYRENLKTVGDKVLCANGKVYNTNGNLPSENGKTDYMNGNAHNMNKYMNGSVHDIKTEILMPSQINFKMINERTFSTRL